MIKNLRVSIGFFLLIGLQMACSTNANAIAIYNLTDSQQTYVSGSVSTTLNSIDWIEV